MRRVLYAMNDVVHDATKTCFGWRRAPSATELLNALGDDFYDACNMGMRDRYCDLCRVFAFGPCERHVAQLVLECDLRTWALPHSAWSLRGKVTEFSRSLSTICDQYEELTVEDANAFAERLEGTAENTATKFSWMAIEFIRQHAPKRILLRVNVSGTLPSARG